MFRSFKSFLSAEKALFCSVPFTWTVVTEMHFKLLHLDTASSQNLTRFINWNDKINKCTITHTHCKTKDVNLLGSIPLNRAPLGWSQTLYHPNICRILIRSRTQSHWLWYVFCPRSLLGFASTRFLLSISQLVSCIHWFWLGNAAFSPAASPLEPG